jgi:glutamine amidotransferase PdxT
MKIHENTVKFGDLTPGDVFKHYANIYMAIHTNNHTIRNVEDDVEVNAIILGNGETMHLKDDTEVILLDAELVVK